MCPSRVLCGPAILSSRSLHRHPFHILNLKGSQITRGPPPAWGPRPELKRDYVPDPSRFLELSRFRDGRCSTICGRGPCWNYESRADLQTVVGQKFVVGRRKVWTPGWQKDTRVARAGIASFAGKRGDALQSCIAAIVRACIAAIHLCDTALDSAALHRRATSRCTQRKAVVRRIAELRCRRAGAVAPRSRSFPLDSNGRPAGRRDGGALHFVQGPGGCREAAAGDGRVEEEGHPGAPLCPRRPAARTAAPLHGLPPAQRVADAGDGRPRRRMAADGATGASCRDPNPRRGQITCLPAAASTLLLVLQRALNAVRPSPPSRFAASALCRPDVERVGRGRSGEVRQHVDVRCPRGLDRRAGAP